MARQLKVAVQMDPMESINIDGDSSFALMLEAQARGHVMWHYDVRNMWLKEGVKRPNGKVKKIYLNKNTVIEDSNGQKISTDALKVGKSVTVNYQKDGDNFVAYKIVRGK